MLSDHEANNLWKKARSNYREENFGSGVTYEADKLLQEGKLTQDERDALVARSDDKEHNFTSL